MSQPKVSVLMPAYNAERYIAEATQSILDQTFTDFEFIIINDGSTDKTAEVIKSFQDPRIVFIDNRNNAGLIAVLNQGFDMARGEYIARLDADDISLPTRFARQVEFMDKNPDVGLLGTRFLNFGACREEISTGDGEIGVLDLMVKDLPIGHPTVMLRKAVFDKYNLRYDPDYVACEDYELWSRVVRYTKMAVLPECLLKYRRHDSQVSILQREIQIKNTNRVKQSILSYLSGSEKSRKSLSFHTGADKVEATIWLFNFIPLLRVVAVRSSKKVYLFHVIPLIKIKKGKALLLHLIPIAKIGDVK
ncbi:hypothetical protein FACS1894186_2660 [Alphaproteobacteria bacterium]|nr:hypothetical protein FACS1894186_2660 [Alphaproteobacteria bacterium]